MNSTCLGELVGGKIWTSDTLRESTRLSCASITMKTTVTLRDPTHERALGSSHLIWQVRVMLCRTLRLCFCAMPTKVHSGYLKNFIRVRNKLMLQQVFDTFVADWFTVRIHSAELSHFVVEISRYLNHRRDIKQASFSIGTTSQNTVKGLEFLKISSFFTPKYGQFSIPRALPRRGDQCLASCRET